MKFCVWNLNKTAAVCQAKVAEYVDHRGIEFRLARREEDIPLMYSLSVCRVGYAAVSGVLLREMGSLKAFA